MRRRNCRQALIANTNRNYMRRSSFMIPREKFLNQRDRLTI